MKILHFMFTIVLIVGAPGETQFQHTMREQCATNSCHENEHCDSEYNFLIKLDNCFQERLNGKPVVAPKDSEGFCKFISRNIVSCLTKPIKKVESEQEKYLRAFMTRLYNTIAERTCTPKKIDKIKKLFSALKRNQCIEQKQLDSKIFRRCSLKMSALTIGAEIKNVCLDVERMNTCLTQIWPRVCREAYFELLTAILKPTIDVCSISPI